MANQPFKTKSAFTGNPVGGQDNKSKMQRAPGMPPSMDPSQAYSSPQPTPMQTPGQPGGVQKPTGMLPPGAKPMPEPGMPGMPPLVRQMAPPTMGAAPQMAGQPGMPQKFLPGQVGPQAGLGQQVPLAAQLKQPQPAPAYESIYAPSSDGNGDQPPPTDTTSPQPGTSDYYQQQTEQKSGELGDLAGDENWDKQKLEAEAAIDDEVGREYAMISAQLGGAGMGASGTALLKYGDLANKAALAKASAITQINAKKVDFELQTISKQLDTMLALADQEQQLAIQEMLLELEQDKLSFAKDQDAWQRIVDTWAYYLDLKEGEYTPADKQFIEDVLKNQIWDAASAHESYNDWAAEWGGLSATQSPSWDTGNFTWKMTTHNPNTGKSETYWYDAALGTWNNSPPK